MPIAPDSRHRLALSSALLGLLALGSCGSPPRPGGSGLLSGTIVDNPATGGKFIVEPNQGGQASALGLVDVRWGRLVDLHGLDPQTGEPASEPLFRDLLVDPLVTSDGVDYLLEMNVALQRERLIILHALESPAFKSALDALESGLQPVLDKGLPPLSLPPYTLWPRNAALALVFDDLLDDGGDPGDPDYPGSVSSQTVRIAVDYQLSVPFEARVLPDANHGDLRKGRFHSTRVLVDPTVSAGESGSSGLPINLLGLPEATLPGQPNVALRVATRSDPSAGQFELLRNLSGHPLGVAGAGSTSPGSPTADVVRALRSGSGQLGDPFNGFLRDDDPPHLVGLMGVDLVALAPQGEARFLLDLRFHAPACAVAPRPGDVVEAGSAVLEVLTQAAAPVAGLVSGVEALLRAGEAPAAPASGRVRVGFDAHLGHRPECFVTFSPGAAEPPSAGVSPTARVLLGFSEPIDPASVDAFETFVLTSALSPPASILESRVVGRIEATSGLDTFAFAPLLPLSHAAGAAETYFVDLLEGANGITDLAGNPLTSPLPRTAFALDPAASALETGGLSLSFSSVDEDGDGGAELRGQVVFDLGRGRIRPREVARFSSLVDTSPQAAPTARAWTPLFGFPEPLSPYGSRTMAVWRYHDLGFGLLDESTHNLDVEGLAWQPEFATVHMDSFPGFEVGLSHSYFLPDEWVDPTTGGVFFPNSGLVASFGSNRLEPTTVVHERARGYMIQPSDAFPAPSGTLLCPWPLNRHLPLDQYRYWTWRDTAVTAVGGPNGQGVDTLTLIKTTGSGSSVYAAGQVPSIGLPLLMDFRTWPSDGALGLNRLMMGTGNSVGIPYFRAWSGGFVGANGQPVLVNPDHATVATGGLDPAGNSIPGTDVGVVYGQADFVVRVNRAHSAWFDTHSGSRFAGAVLVPSHSQQPDGTRVQIAYRGALQVTSAALASDAANLDPYGDPTGGAFGVIYLGGDPSWHEDLAQLDGARYVQMRITLVANAATSSVPELSAIGVAFHK